VQKLEHGLGRRSVGLDATYKADYEFQQANSCKQ
jgi:hypothetical protein